MSGAVVIRRQNKYMELFNKLGAVDLGHSISIDEVGIRRHFVFNRMIARGIFIECEAGRFYIDNEAADRFKTQRRKKAILVLIGLAVFLVIYFLAGGR